MKKKFTIRMMLIMLMLTMSTNFAYAGGLFKIVEGISDSTLKSSMERNVNSLMVAFNTSANRDNRTVKLSKDYMTIEAIKDVELMWKSSAMRFPPVNIKSRCLKTARGYQVRGIPMDVIEAGEDEKRQELTIDFLPNGKIYNVSIAIDMHRYDQIIAENKTDLDFARRQIIIDFVENFRTAYNRKDINLIKSVFSDNALIITGKVITEMPNTDIEKYTLKNDKVIYVKQSKKEYIQRLTSVFKNNKYIDVKFEDIEVVQHPKYDDIYGVTLKQTWRSNYNDEGYLFLLIDFKDQDSPVIHVRTWQPYKNKQGQIITKEEDVYHIGSFKIVR